MRKHCLLALLALFCGTAQAVMITVEPDDYSDGAGIDPYGASVSFVLHADDSDQLTYAPAVSMRHESCSPPYTCMAPTGSQMMGFEGPFGGTTAGLTEVFAWHLSESPIFPSFGHPDLSEYGRFYGLRVDFHRPTDFFSAETLSYSGDIVILFAYSQSGQLLEQWGVHGHTVREFPTPCVEDTCRGIYSTITAQRAQRDIAFVIVGSNDSWAGIDAISYDVPEPSTLAFMGIGLLILGISVNRKRVER